MKHTNIALLILINERKRLLRKLKVIAEAIKIVKAKRG